MSDKSSTGFHGLFSNFDTGGGMPDGKDNVALFAFANDGHHSREFGGAGDDADGRGNRRRGGSKMFGAVTGF